MTANPRAFRVAARNAMFRHVLLAARRDWTGLAELGSGLDAQGWEDLLTPYFDEYEVLGTDSAARGPKLFQVTENGTSWNVRQVLDDPDGDHGWSFDAVIDLEASAESNEVVFEGITVTAG
jgi:hypothetical protein